MAVSSVNRIGGTSANKSIEETTFTDLYRVITTAATDTHITVLAAAGLPQVTDTYGADAAFYVSRQTPNQSQEEPTVWEVAVEYTDRREDDNGSVVPSDNPLSNPPSIEWREKESSVPVYEDRDGNAVANSAREVFDPAPEKDHNDATLVYRRNEIFFSADLLLNFSNRVNSDVFAGAPAGVAKIRSITASKRFDSGIFYWEVTYTVDFRFDGWAIRVLDHGFTELSGGNQQVITDANGVPLSAPSYLNGFGIVSASPVFLDFDVYEEKAFAPLGLNV